ncbi:PDZ and LIM domain protein 1-like, partial [Vombatus ursinus]|uniref:PDZ and LIM domain protein 1-like n=1 Tax=Vombatus ursinus TaxID=29139 RepID=UPI000FFCFD2B
MMRLFSTLCRFSKTMPCHLLKKGGEKTDISCILQMEELKSTQVTPGSKAALANVCIGDVILAIDGENTSNMTHLEAQNKIKSCIDDITLTVGRSEHKIWSPLVTEEGKRHPYKMNLASEPQ